MLTDCSLFIWNSNLTGVLDFCFLSMATILIEGRIFCFAFWVGFRSKVVHIGILTIWTCIYYLPISGTLVWNIGHAINGFSVGLLLFKLLRLLSLSFLKETSPLPHTHNIKLIHEIKEILTIDRRTSKGCSIFWPTSMTELFELIGKCCMLAGFNWEICFPLRVICLMGCRNAFSLLQKAFSHLLMVQLPHLFPTPKLMLWRVHWTQESCD